MSKFMKKNDIHAKLNFKHVQPSYKINAPSVNISKIKFMKQELDLSHFLDLIPSESVNVILSVFHLWSSQVHSQFTKRTLRFTLTKGKSIPVQETRIKFITRILC